MHDYFGNMFEYIIIPLLQCLYSNYSEQSLTVGTMPENKVLNRFKNIIPCMSSFKKQTIIMCN